MKLAGAELPDETPVQSSPDNNGLLQMLIARLPPDQKAKAEAAYGKTADDEHPKVILTRGNQRPSL